MTRTRFGFYRAALLTAAIALAGTTFSGTLAAQDRPGSTVDSLTVKVTDAGFEPAKLTVKKDEPVHLTFLRTSDKTCATEVVFPEQKITKELPLNQPVKMDVTFKAAGDVTFMCGQKMFKGTIVVQPS